MAAHEAEKRIRIPIEMRVPFSSMAADAARLGGINESVAVIDMVMRQALPAGTLPRSEMLAVHGGKTLLRSVGDVLRSNVTGATGTVAHRDYKGIADFGLGLIWEKNAEGILLIDQYGLSHLTRCLGSCIDFMECAPRDPEDPFAEAEALRGAEYGRGLAQKLMVGAADGDAVYHAAYFAVEYFDMIGAQNSTCAYLADLFTALGDSLAALVKSDPDYRVPADTPELRRKWAETLESTCKDW